MAYQNSFEFPNLFLDVLRVLSYKQKAFPWEWKYDLCFPQSPTARSNCVAVAAVKLLQNFLRSFVSDEIVWVIQWKDIYKAIARGNICRKLSHLSKHQCNFNALTGYSLR